MGDKASELEPGTDLQELVANEDYDELVSWACPLTNTPMRR